MNWLEVKVDTAPAGLDAVSERLEALGVTGLVIDDEADFHDFLENNRACWDYVDEALEESFSGVSCVKFWLSCDAEGEKVLATYAPDPRRYWIDAGWITAIAIVREWWQR